jgi:hypothetical protein
LNPVRIQTKIANIASKNQKKSSIKKFENSDFADAGFSIEFDKTLAWKSESGI